ncbi:MAG: hypothetical protein GY861_09590 [bacterium]|nr:hypothetical protein [bacterium]
MRSGIDINTESIEDEVLRDNFVKIREEFEEALFNRFTGKHFEITFTQAETNFKYPHNLGFWPKDVLQTFITGAGAVTWNYGLFDGDDLDITTTGACTVRAFIGAFSEE